MENGQEPILRAQEENSSLYQDAQRVLDPVTTPQGPQERSDSATGPALGTSPSRSSSAAHVCGLGLAQHPLWQEVHMKSHQDLLIHCIHIIGAACGFICLALWTPRVSLASVNHLVLGPASATEALVQPCSGPAAPGARISVPSPLL